MRSLAAAVGLICGTTVAQAQDGASEAYSLSNPVPADRLRDLSTDRPDKTESPYTVDAGHIQVELDFVTYTTDRDRSGGGDVRTRTLNIAPINFKLGLARSADLQFVFDSFSRQTTDDRTTGTRERIEGIGDVTVRFKRNLWGNDGGDTAFALMPFVKLPTNTGGLGHNAVEAGIIAPLAISVTEQIGIGLMTEIDLLREANGSGYAPSFVNSVTVSGDLTNRIGLYGEIFTEQSSERGARFVVTFDTGVTYALSDNMQLDFGVNLGVTDAADDLNLFVGLSQRF